MTKFNDFEKNIDFSFWKELCHTKGKLRSYRRGECFAHTGDIIKRVGWVETGSFKHSLINEKVTMFAEAIYLSLTRYKSINPGT